MTKDEIKKALGICAELCPELCKRFDCPYYTQNCTDDILKDALNLITEQEKEIELLKMQMKDVVNHADTFLAEEQKFEAENVKLKAKIEQLKAKNKVLGDGVAKAYTNGFTDGRKQVEKDIRRAKIDVLNKVKNCREATDSDCYPYLERIVNKLINEVKDEHSSN